MKESLIHVVAHVPFAEETRLNKYQPHHNWVRGPANVDTTLHRDLGLLYEIKSYANKKWRQRIEKTNRTHRSPYIRVI